MREAGLHRRKEWCVPREMETNWSKDWRKIAKQLFFVDN